MKFFGIGATLLFFSGLAQIVQADVLGDFGVFTQTSSCGWIAQYNTARGGAFGPNAPGPCSVTGSAPTAPGLAAASVGVSAAQTGGSQSPETGSGRAAALLSTASLHAVSSASGPSPTTPAFNTFNGSDAQLWDTLTFTIPGATNTTVTNIPVFFSVDGTVDNNPSATSWGATLQFSSTDTFCCNANEVTWEGDVNGFIFPGNIGLASGTFTAASDPFPDSINWLTPRVNTQTDLVEEGILLLTGPTAAVHLFANLDTKAGGAPGLGGNDTVNFGDTAGVSFQLPQGVSYTSASGVFGTASAVPEPSLFGWCGLAMVGLVVFRRKLIR